VAGVTVGPATLRILKPGEDGLLRPLIAAEPDAVLVRNLGSLALLREALPAAELVGDFSLNVANDLTAAWLIGQGLTRLVPSYDLNWEQLQSLARRFDPTRLEVVVHHHMPMFHTEHCVFAAFLSTGKDWRDCGRPCDRHRVDLHDRVGAAFPVVADTGCRNTVYNSLPQSAAEYIGRMRELGVRHLRVELLRESAEQVGPLLDAYAQVALGGGDARHVWREVRAVNRLGLTRGTLQLV
jgi:putative protease